jgi:hypothetical protein
MKTKSGSKKVTMFYVEESPFGSSKQKNCRGIKDIECNNYLIFFINVGFGKMP